MRHVGDVHSHLPESVVETSYREGIVKIFRIAWVDGTGEDIAEIFSFGNVFLRNLGRNFLRSLFHVGRILIWQSILGENGIHLGVVVALLTQNIDHLAKNVLVLAVGPCLDLHDSLVASLSALDLLFRDNDVVRQQSVLCDEEGEVFLHPQTSYELVACVFEDADDHSLLDMPFATCHERHLHLVAVERRHGVAFSHEDWLAAVVGDEAVFAVRLTSEDSLLHLCLGIEAIRVFAYLCEEVVPCHLFHDVDGKHLQRMSV